MDESLEVLNRVTYRLPPADILPAVRRLRVPDGWESTRVALERELLREGGPHWESVDLFAKALWDACTSPFAREGA